MDKKLRTVRVPMTLQTWTFCGHWEGDEIVVDYALAGQVEDERIDVGQYEQGLWSDSASGYVIAEAQERALAEYVPEVREQLNAKLLGAAELAELAGASRNTVHNWRNEYDDFPTPLKDLAMGPIYHLFDVKDFLRRHPNLGKPTVDLSV